MDNALWPIVAQVLIAAVTFGSGWFLLRSQRRKIDAEVQDTTVSTMRMVIVEVRNELDRARKRIDELERCQTTLERQVHMLSEEKERQEIEIVKMRKRVLVLARGVGRLTDQIRDLGHEPVWTDAGEETED